LTKFGEERGVLLLQEEKERKKGLGELLNEGGKEKGGGESLPVRRNEALLPFAERDVQIKDEEGKLLPAPSRGRREDKTPSADLKGEKGGKGRRLRILSNQRHGTSQEREGRKDVPSFHFQRKGAVEIYLA